VQRLTVALGAIFFLIAALFTLSLLSVPVLPRLAGLNPAVRRAVRPSLPAQPRLAPERQRFLALRARQKLLAEIRQEQRANHARQGRLAAARDSASPAIIGAFYAVWQETGIHSLGANADHLTHLFPVWLRLGPESDDLDTRDWDPALSPHNLDVLRICRDHGIAIHPVLANAHEGAFDSLRAHRLLVDPARQDRLARAARSWLVARGFRGLNVDLEKLSTADAALVPGLLARLRREFVPAGLALSFDLQVAGEVPPAAAVARWCDFVVLMGYDQHGRNDEAGPLCGARWFADALDRTLREIPPAKLLCGIGAYGYDWTGGRPPGDGLTYQQAVSVAADERPDDPPEGVVDFDPGELNATYSYRDDDGREHEVWMLDAASAANQRTLALERGVQGAAVWVLGSEDPDVWDFLDRAHPDARPDTARLAATSYPFDVDFSGDGELLTLQSQPQRGSRSIEQDPATGLMTDETYHRYPLPYILHREGFRKGAIALTFDDGPSSPWTDDILDVLERDSVRATFFVIGQNAERHPDLIHRLWDEGHEIGNHTFTHPNLAAVTPERMRLELTATQRVIEADLGRSTVLFRAPYNADAEPTSAEEVSPVLGAAGLGYITVGEYLDPQDWDLMTADESGRTRQRTGADIARAVLEEVGRQHGNTVLLHDGGGDRSRTVQALQLLIPALKRQGYQFVTVSELAGLTRDQVMPAVSARDWRVRGVDRITFDIVFVVETFLYWAFLTAIGLGAARVTLMTLLALIAAARRRPRTPRGFHPAVSVLIAARNERPVIARTLRAVLDGHEPPLEVIVVDDGSTDGTSEEVERATAGDPSVSLVRQANAGKAAALDRAVALARGEVLVCLDADTLFTPDTLARLVRPFADPRVGAVAGNVKVGNRINLWTRWQSIEYVVSQNLDRRAYALLNAVTVVPGAVGAWRREAVVRAGGFLADTFAEDMDLSWRLRRDGWRIANESGALGFTEAPDSLSALFRQRFRWTYGTLQCLWKHRDALGRYGWFGRLALPSLWLFQIVYQVLSPIIDLEILWTLWRVGRAYLSSALLTRDWQPLPQAMESFTGIATLFVFFFLLELAGAGVAYWLDRQRPRDLLWLFWQRFVYRQIMYAVALASVRQAIEGHRAAWGRLERKGTAKTARA
jgi:cellulose synthase/poly-beta-1,6-N-acetylglucosamine synthase-like glycosyltransferase/peptidoglycan/xylan/chitin deacetylase (PgdA/CDA1 family)